MTSRYVLVLGSNVGQSQQNIKNCISLLKENGVQVLKITEELHTLPRLNPHQHVFLNCGVLILCEHSPLQLLQIIKTIELQLGRVYRERYGPREIDIDIVWWEQGMWRSSELCIPHKFNSARFWVRQFLAELVPDAKDILLGIHYKNMNAKSLIRVQDFHKKKINGEKITMLTCYDFSMAKLFARTSLDTVLVGDSLGNVVQGYKNTLPVTVEDILYHTKAVRRGLPDMFITSDLPFMSYETGTSDALRNAGRIIKDGAANAVKLEGADEHCEIIYTLSRNGIPVMGHLGFTPQSILSFGGYRIQGKDDAAANKILEQAHQVEDSGAFALVLEMVPPELAGRIAKELAIPVIGIGAGNDIDGQVLVINDVLGLDPDFKPRFVRHYANLADTITRATEEYCEDVRLGKFPSEHETYTN